MSSALALYHPPAKSSYRQVPKHKHVYAASGGKERCQVCGIAKRGRKKKSAAMQSAMVLVQQAPAKRRRAAGSRRKGRKMGVSYTTASKRKFVIPAWARAKGLTTPAEVMADLRSRVGKKGRRKASQKPRKSSAPKRASAPKKSAALSAPRPKKASAPRRRRRYSVPRKPHRPALMVQPHAGKITCVHCGEVHDLRSHHSHKYGGHSWGRGTEKSYAGVAKFPGGKQKQITTLAQAHRFLEVEKVLGLKRRKR